MRKTLYIYTNTKIQKELEKKLQHVIDEGSALESKLQESVTETTGVYDELLDLNNAFTSRKGIFDSKISTVVSLLQITL
jgi:hypothetical protein